MQHDQDTRGVAKLSVGACASCRINTATHRFTFSCLCENTIVVHLPSSAPQLLRLHAVAISASLISSTPLDFRIICQQQHIMTSIFIKCQKKKCLFAFREDGASCKRPSSGGEEEDIEVGGRCIHGYCDIPTSVKRRAVPTGPSIKTGNGGDVIIHGKDGNTLTFFCARVAGLKTMFRIMLTPFFSLSLSLPLSLFLFL